MKTIHFYIHNSFPEGMAAARRQLCYAKGLLAEGNVVDVNVCHKLEDVDRGLPSVGNVEGVPFRYISGRVKHKNKFLRGLDYKLFDFLRMYRYAFKNIHKGDVVFCYFYGMICHLIMIFIAHIKGAKVVKEVCEYPYVFEKQTIKTKMMRYTELKLIFPLYDGFIAISKELEKLVLKYKSSVAKSILVPILVDGGRKSTKSKDLIENPYILHTGTMFEQKDSISIILKAFALFKRNDKNSVKLVFTGPQANSHCQYLNMINDLSISNYVDLMGLVSNEEIVALQEYASLSIVYKSDNLQTRNCFPTKLGEMLYAGVPVITTPVGDANLYLKDKVNAFIVKEGDIDELANAISLAFENPKLCREIGLNGKKVAESDFNPYFQGKRLSQFYNSL